MSEKFPMIPANENLPAPSKEEVIQSLRDDPKNTAILERYCDKRENEVRTTHDNVLLSIDIAEIYRDTGLVEDARKAFGVAADQAWQEDEEELFERIMNELESLE